MNDESKYPGIIFKTKLKLPDVSSCGIQFSQRIDEIISNYEVPFNYDFELEEEKLLDLIRHDSTKIKESSNNPIHLEEHIEYSARYIGHLIIFFNLVSRNMESSYIDNYFNRKMAEV